jgi:hypothetical protein
MQPMETTTTTAPTEMMKMPEPQEEHRWLLKLAGEWTMEAESSMAPGEPPVKSTGIERVRALGDLWIVGESEGEMPGHGPSQAILTLGYDPAKQRFVGTWVGSMMTHLWVYEGRLDAGKKVLTLDCEGPGMAGDGSLMRYQDVIELKSDDHRTLTSHMQGEDGTWQPFMTAHYRRRKPSLP